MAIQPAPGSFQARPPQADDLKELPAIECELDCQRAVERIAALAGCLEDSDEDVELALLIECYERWEARRWLQ
jgi:hypothetical protein